MITSERRARADRALNQIDKLELEIRAQMGQNNLQGDLDANYADFKAYAKLRELHEQYSDWKKQYHTYADNVDLVEVVGQSEHDILREHYVGITSKTEIVALPSAEMSQLYERESGTGEVSKVRYQITFEKVKILPFHTVFVSELDILFIRTNHAGVPQ